ncbi:hypothetical protein QE152_g5297 [Popillia japonica]|uniref:Uncharacterized protein n=1 Tax=Popillia japonica TaxID=7064 RepID=A0AAW1MMU4_POPJA
MSERFFDDPVSNGMIPFQIIATTSFADMSERFFDDPVSTYGFHNFLPDALEYLRENDDIVIAPPDVDNLTDEEELDADDLLNVGIPNDVAGVGIRIQIMETFPHEDHWDSSDDELLGENGSCLSLME